MTYLIVSFVFHTSFVVRLVENKWDDSSKLTLFLGIRKTRDVSQHCIIISGRYNHTLVGKIWEGGLLQMFGC